MYLYILQLTSVLADRYKPVMFFSHSSTAVNSDNVSVIASITNKKDVVVCLRFGTHIDNMFKNVPNNIMTGYMNLMSICALSHKTVVVISPIVNPGIRQWSRTWLESSIKHHGPGT